MSAFSYYELEELVREEMERCSVPGVALAITDRDGVLYARGFGVTSLEDGGTAVSPRTLFRVGSTTKPLTGIAVLRLVEEGALDLDAPVRRYVPWLELNDSEAAERISLRMLLSHTSGLPADSMDFGPRDPEKLEAHLREALPRYELVGAPGERYCYSNVGINLAGYVAEAVGGRYYAELMRELVLDPLGMSLTTFDPTVAMTYSVAQSHVADERGRPVVEHRYGDHAGRYPCGSAISNVLDLSSLAQLLLGSGCFRGRHVLSERSFAEMTRSHARVDDGSEYGLTLRLEERGGVRLVGHDGRTNNFGCVLKTAPERGVGVVMLNNRADAFSAGADRVLTRVLGGLLSG